MGLRELEPSNMPSAGFLCCINAKVNRTALTFDKNNITSERKLSGPNDNKYSATILWVLPC